MVSTANILTGHWWGAQARFDEAGTRGGASLFGSGVNPGFVNQLVLTATGARPGVVTYKDLPLITAAGCVRT